MSINRSPLKAIRAKCIDCCCGVKAEVRMCPSKTCPLWPFRSGHRLPKEIVDGVQADREFAATSAFSEDADDSDEEDLD